MFKKDEVYFAGIMGAVAMFFALIVAENNKYSFILGDVELTSYCLLFGILAGFGLLAIHWADALEILAEEKAMKEQEEKEQKKAEKEAYNWERSQANWDKVFQNWAFEEKGMRK